MLGKTFMPTALAELTGSDGVALDQLLGALVRKEVLGLQSDPRSPEHGQYGFLQDLLRQVAYETLPKRERRAKHLKAADHLRATMGEDEVAEVVASHLLEAYRLEPDAPDGERLRAKAQGALVQAGERASSLGASTEARRYFEQAGELSGDPSMQAAALARAGEMAMRELEVERAESLFEWAITLCESAGDTHAAARVSSWLAFAEQMAGRLEQAIERMESAYEVVAGDAPDEDLALLLNRLGQALWFAGRPEQAAERIEQALDIAESLQLPEMLVRGWMVKAGIISPRRPEEARGLYRLALDTILEHELPILAGSMYANLSDLGSSATDTRTRSRSWSSSSSIPAEPGTGGTSCSR